MVGNEWFNALLLKLCCVGQLKEFVIPRGPTQIFYWQGGHSDVSMTGGPTEVHIKYFYTPKNPNFRILSTQKNPTPTENCACVIGDLNWWKVLTQKLLVFFLWPITIPTSFIDPKKSLLAKISDPKKIPRTPFPSIKYVSGAPGLSFWYHYERQ